MGDLLLRLLEEDPGRFVSGEEIGRRMGTTRAAVWKQVCTLRRRGFGIAGARGAGYRLLGRPDVIEETDVLSRLSSRSFWKSFTFLPVTDSTNSRAAEAAERGAPHGSIFCADAQTGGRGRFDRRWESPPGGTLYLRPNTVHLMILIDISMSTGGRGVAWRGRSGKLLILRLTPRGLRRLRLETTRSWRISLSTLS